MNMFFVLLALNGMAQDNNPYNKRGIDYYNSLNIISADFNAGKVKEINQESLSKYSRLIPLQNQVSVELASAVVKTIKSPGFTLGELINKSSLSSYAKETVPQLLNVRGVSTAEFRKFLTAKTDEIKMAKISEAEKEILLSFVAISYHSTAAFTGRRGDCRVEMPNYSGPVSPETCIAAASVAGFFIAFPICGILCGLGGAIIGGVASALS